MADNLHSLVMERVRTILGTSDSEAAQLAAVVHLLAKYRGELLKGYVIAQCGCQVLSGPFAGLQISEQVAEGCSVPKLLGSYEAELHPIIEQLSRRPYQVVLNIGCAEGYYAAGFARLWPQAQIYAFDDNKSAQQLCRQVALANNVAQRVQVAGYCDAPTVARLAAAGTLIWCDIEGAEMELLDPLQIPQLAHCDLLVETHDLFRRGSSAELARRFKDTHDVSLINAGARDPKQFHVLRELPELERWLAVWEWRSGPTPWALMLARDRS